jgi:hypothetical protein
MKSIQNREGYSYETMQLDRLANTVKTFLQIYGYIYNNAYIQAQLALSSLSCHSYRGVIPINLNKANKN